MPIREVVPLTPLEDLRFGGWDVFPDDAYEAARHAGVLEAPHLEAVREELSAIRPMKAAFQPQYVRRLEGSHIKRTPRKAELVEQLRADIRETLATQGCDRAVGLWCGSTEVHVAAGPAHQSVEAFCRGLERDDPSITNSQLYAWAHLEEGIPFANCSPNLAWTSRPRSSLPPPTGCRWVARI